MLWLWVAEERVRCSVIRCICLRAGYRTVAKIWGERMEEVKCGTKELLVHYALPSLSQKFWHTEAGIAVNHEVTDC